MNSIQRRTHKTGFTLIELIVVIAILAVLTLIIVPNVTKYTTSANTTVCETNRKTILREMSYGILSGKYTDESSAFTAVVGSHGGKATAGTSTITATDICPNGGTYTYSYDSSTNTVTIDCDKHGSVSGQSNGTVSSGSNFGSGNSSSNTYTFNAGSGSKVITMALNPWIKTGSDSQTVTNGKVDTVYTDADGGIYYFYKTMNIPDDKNLNDKVVQNWGSFAKLTGTIYTADNEKKATWFNDNQQIICQFGDVYYDGDNYYLYVANAPGVDTYGSLPPTSNTNEWHLIPSNS